MYKRQGCRRKLPLEVLADEEFVLREPGSGTRQAVEQFFACLLYTSDAADERSSVDLGGRRIIKKKNIATSFQFGLVVI